MFQMSNISGAWWGIQETGFADAPILENPTTTRRLDGRVYRFYFNGPHLHLDRKSTRLNSSHVEISYAAFCLKKKRPLAMVFTFETDASKFRACIEETGRSQLRCATWFSCRSAWSATCVASGDCCP